MGHWQGNGTLGCFVFFFAFWEWMNSAHFETVNCWLGSPCSKFSYYSRGKMITFLRRRLSTKPWGLHQKNQRNLLYREISRLKISNYKTEDTIIYRSRESAMHFVLNVANALLFGAQIKGVRWHCIAWGMGPGMRYFYHLIWEESLTILHH